MLADELPNEGHEITSSLKLFFRLVGAEPTDTKLHNSPLEISRRGTKAAA
jgi:hypothetical protein